jgi:hypothetical protein
VLACLVLAYLPGASGRFGILYLVGRLRAEDDGMLCLELVSVLVHVVLGSVLSVAALIADSRLLFVVLVLIGWVLASWSLGA